MRRSPRGRRTAVSSRVESVAIVGRDAPAGSPRRPAGALRPHRLRVQVVELRLALSTVDVYAAVPSHSRDSPLARPRRKRLVLAPAPASDGGQRFSNWAKAKPAFMHAMTTTRAPRINLPISRNIGPRRAPRVSPSISRISRLGSRLPRSKSLRAEQRYDERPSTARYGYHLDAQDLRTHCSSSRPRLASEAAPGAVGRGEQRAEPIQSRRAGRRDRIARPICIIDASGSGSALIGATGRRPPFESVEPCAAVRPPARRRGPAAHRRCPRSARSRPSQYGWVGLFPLQNRTAMSRL